MARSLAHSLIVVTARVLLGSGIVVASRFAAEAEMGAGGNGKRRSCDCQGDPALAGFSSPWTMNG
jgi:hypothetical protein